jgi:hypothetical protein
MRRWIVVCMLLGTGALAFGSAVQDVASQLRQAFPEVQLYTEGGQVAQVYGTTFGYGLSLEASADNFVQTYAEVFGVLPTELLPGNVFTAQYTLPLLYDEQTDTYKATLLYYRQYKDGIPVYGADLRLLVENAPGYPLVLANSTLCALGNFAVPAGAAVNVQEGAARAAAAAFAPGLSDFSDSELVIWPDSDGIRRQPHVALTFVAAGFSPRAEPLKWRFVCDAATGALLHTENLILFTDVTGNVSSLATTIPKAEQCNPEVATPMAYATVSIQGGSSAYADANGNFTIPNGGSAPVTVQSPMSGHYFTVNNYGSGGTETLTQTVTPPGPANFVHNAANTSESIRAQVNAYVQANVIRDWVLVQNPSYPTISTQTGFPLWIMRTDIYCPGNAWYDGSSLNFCAANIGQNYGDTAYSSVVHHEYGHHIVASGGSGQDQYGEGLGDSVAVVLADDPILGYGFFYNDCANGIRTAANNMQYPCTSDIHTCAQLLSGCIWSTRNELVNGGHADYLAVLSKLLVNSVPLHGSGGSITPAIGTTFLTLDNTYYGGAHADHITAGFGAHSMIPLPPPANDACVSAIEACPGQAYTGSTGGATVDGATNCGTSSSTPDVWYKYTPATSGSATFSLCGSGTTYDSVLSIHSACPGTSGNTLNCNNDGCGGTGSPSTITRSVTAGTTYMIRISGHSGATGNYSLTITGPACQGANYTLTTSVVGQGSIALNPPGGSYPPGTSVQLTANAASGWHFDHWSGDLSGSTNPTNLVMDANKSVTATFVQDQYTLTVNVVGQGSVALNPPGGTYPSGTSVQLTANATAGWHFDHWSGDLTGSANPATLVMNGNKTVTATFVQDQYTLTVNVVGQGSVALNPPGGTYPSGTSVQLTANAATGWHFDHWSGDLSGSTNPATLVMNSNKTVTATFVQDQYTLTVNVVGQGSVALNPPGGTYPSGTSVQLTANAATGWHFDHWSGDLSGSTNPTNLVMDANKSVTATFVQDQYTLTVNVVGQGSVALNPPGGTYPSGTSVQLTANAATGWHFDHWSGDLAGSTNPASIVMDSDKSVTATFVQDEYTLTVNVVGQGSVALNPPGGTYPSGTIVQLTASAAAGWHFDSWSGDLTGTANPISVTVGGNLAVTAHFGLLGDMTCDGLVGFGDINPFVLAITNAAQYEAAFPGCYILHGDFNGNGVVDFGDINPFVALLTSR